MNRPAILVLATLLCLGNEFMQGATKPLLSPKDAASKATATPVRVPAPPPSLLNLPSLAPAAPATNYSVKLGWDASTGTNRPFAYYVHQGNKPGIYTAMHIVGAVEGLNTFTVPGLLFNTQYYFAVTAVDAATGEESDYSNEVAVPPTSIVLVSQIESTTNWLTWRAEARLTNTLYFSNQPPQKWFRDKLTIQRQ